MAEAAALYQRFRERAREIAASLNSPDFYREEAAAVAFSRTVFDLDPLVAVLRRYAAEHLDDDLGHGVLHATKVALDAGALLIIESRPTGPAGEALARRICLVQCAGLLHDIRRKLKNHAECGAEHVRELLRDFPLSAIEIEDICLAIRNHEAFKNTAPVRALEGAILSDCLYDADKFRWGPDNFTDTLWAMVAFSGTPVAQFIDYYPRGMQGLIRIKATFRTPAGRKYGPQFIDRGIAIGEELYRFISANKPG
jgi:hypothetical protein